MRENIVRLKIDGELKAKQKVINLLPLTLTIEIKLLKYAKTSAEQINWTRTHSLSCRAKLQP